MPHGPGHAAGDALARLRVRWEEVEQSFGLLRQAADDLAERARRSRPALPCEPPSGAGRRGGPRPRRARCSTTCELADGRIVRCRPRSASFHNLVLMHEVFAGDILTDFPFIEASFGLSVAGVAQMSHLGAARPARRRGHHPLARPARRLRGRLARPGSGRWVSGPTDAVDPALCPTGAISSGDQGGSHQGRCILCGRCVAARPDLFGWSQGATGPGAAGLTRDALVVPGPPETDEALAAARARLRTRTAALRRSVHLRHVDAGSDGSEEWEIQALLGPVYDIHRLGMFFTASPRHADVLLVTGAGARGMPGRCADLRRDARSQGRDRGGHRRGQRRAAAASSEAITGGVGGMVPVDVWLPGSPPSPFSILNALLLALGGCPLRKVARDERSCFAAGLVLLAAAGR